jgi:hypothetical protein
MWVFLKFNATRLKSAMWLLQYLKTMSLLTHYACAQETNTHPKYATWLASRDMTEGLTFVDWLVTSGRENATKANKMVRTYRNM